MPVDPRDIVLYTFGPVQTFISASRRTQDLAISSLILSSLAKAGLSYVEDENELDLIFPFKSGGKWSRRLPNRIVFLAPPEKGKGFVTGLEEQIRARWNEISEGVKQYLYLKTKERGWEAQWDSQVGDWLESYWVSILWDGKDDTYSEAFRTLNLGIDARKNARHYPKGPQSGVKCSLSGIRSAIGVGKATNIWDEIRSNTNRTELRDTEHLSAITAIKRFADKANVPGLDLDRFPSTSSIAVSSFKQQLLLNWSEMEESAGEFLAAVEQLGLIMFTKPEPFPSLLSLMGDDPQKEKLMRLEGDYFYKEFYTYENVSESRKENLPKLREGAESIKLIANCSKALSSVIEEMAELSKNTRIDVPFPNNYFAALAMDGDHMGKLIDDAGSLEAHKEISLTMAKTANEIENLVEKDYPGILIYSSGDDVLALLPVNCALQAARRIRDTFKKNMVAIGQNGEMSGGMAIMHHRSPLAAILEKARQAEHKAKEEYGRSAIVVSILKRSGEDLHTAMKWPPPEEGNPFDDILNLLSRGLVSSKFIYELRNEQETLKHNLAGLELEISRLLNRHLSSQADASEIADLPERVINFRNYMPFEEDRISELVNWMMVTKFLVKGEQV